MWAVCPRLWFVCWFLTIMAHFWENFLLLFLVLDLVLLLFTFYFFELNFANMKQLIVAIPLICKILFDEVEFFQTGISCCEPKGGKS